MVILGQKTSVLKNFLDDQVLLICEPSQNYRSSIKRFLENMHVTNVIVVNDPVEARREMLTNKVGFFIVEKNLENQNGLEFCRELRTSKNYADSAFLMLSSENLRKDVILASEASIDGYLLKPFSYDDFQDQIETIVRMKENPSVITKLCHEARKNILANEYADAEKLIEEATQEDNSNAMVFYTKGLLYEAQKKYDDALKLFKKSLRLKPMYLDAMRGMISVFDATGDHENLLKVALKAHNLSPDNPRYTLIIARAYLSKGDLEQSTKYFADTIDLSPKLSEGYKGLGDVSMAKKDYKDAQSHYMKALDLNKSDIKILNSIGLSFVKLGDIKEAIVKYKLALKLDPFDARVLFNMAYAYEKSEQYEQARRYYNQALHYRPDYAKAKRRLSILVQKTRATSGEGNKAS